MRLFYLVLLAFLVAFPALAETTPWVKLDNSQVRLVAGADDAGKFRAGLGIQLDDGWDTYWRTPGDAGLPVAIDTTGSTNLKSASILWPTPQRSIKFGNLETFIYMHSIMFPLVLEAENSAEPIHVKMKVKYAACKEICTFLSHDFELDLATDKKLSAEETKLLNDADATLSTPMDKQTDLAITSTALDHDATHIQIEATSVKGFDKPDLLAEGGTAFRFSEVDATLSEGNKKAVILAPVQPMLSDQTIIGKEITFTLVDHRHGVEWKSTLAAPSGMNYSIGRFLLMLLSAIVGGLILNIMPCVLPVLSLKILGVLKKSGKESPIVRRSFLASAAGIIASFMVLAGLVVGLQVAGKTVGWGFQFQEPYFLIILSLILTFFAANLFGLFEICLPQFLSNFALRKAGKSEGYLEHFLTGAFATLMATPCSAPFLGTAIGFAFSQGAFEIFALFFAMGIGLSLPYLAFAAFPKLVKLLPKPGAWMVKAKMVLGILLLATAMWILWVLAAQEGVITSLVIAVMLGLLIIAFRLPKKLVLGTVAAITMICLILPVLLMQEHEEQPQAVSTDLWQDFDLGKVKTLVADGKVVMVDVTADWCLTCKANKLLVLNTKEVVEMLKSRNTVAMKADWTNRDPAIADYLKSFGRYGIPFNVVYGPGAPKGIALPELLSEDKVRKALEKARGAAVAKDDPRPSELP